MAGQNTFENLLLNDANMIEEQGNKNENTKYVPKLLPKNKA